MFLYGIFSICPCRQMAEMLQRNIWKLIVTLAEPWGPLWGEVMREPIGEYNDTFIVRTHALESMRCIIQRPFKNLMALVP